MKNKKVTITIVSVIALLLLVVGATFAWFNLTVRGTKTNTITTGGLSLVIENEINEINLKDAFPSNDEEGKRNTPTSFILYNNGSRMIDYTVKLVEDEEAKAKCTGCKFIPASMVRYEITVVGEAKEAKNLTSNGTVLDTGTIKKGTKITYQLKIWLDSEATNEASAAYFFGKLEIEAVQNPTNPEYVDTSGASKPELDDGMIPVIYDEISSSWKKADTSSEWYNYEKQNWANVVTVYQAMRTTYLNAPSGTEIPMTDINTMWVWIPRYSYTIGNTYGVQLAGGSTPSKATPGAIDIKFVSKTDALENGTAKYTGSTPNNWYTHPAFCFGTLTTVDNRTTCDGGEVNGIWVAKFEAGAPESDPCSTSPSYTNCNKNTLSLASKPNMSSWRYIQPANMFTAVKNNMNGASATATYGFSEAGGDSHMMKNSEWGAVAYLTQSKYGKYGNASYTGANKEIYINNYISTSGYVDPLKTMTGCSSGAPSTAYAVGNCAFTYDKVTDRGSGTGSGGAGASTTGNISGIYDMSGAGDEYVMGNFNGYSGRNANMHSGFTGPLGEGGSVTGVAFPEARYYDKYTGTTGFKGDTTNADGTNGWYSDVAIFVSSSSPWFVRGGDWSYTSVAGAFDFLGEYGRMYHNYSFRLVRAPLV